FFMLKFQKTIEDFFTLPISFTNIVLSQLVSGIIRGFLIMIALSIVGIFFGVGTLMHPFLLFLYVLLISFMFGLIGMVVGIWADDSFEKIGIATNFILTPLSFLGGAFYSVGMLPTSLQFLVHFNPIFYAIDGIRYCFTGFHDVSLILGIVILSSISIIFLGIVVFIFKTG
ncbi:MAG: ABC transporter permease, partial [Alphaproteobacteria bacterium]|nr:ABC transporter permease [Alphaproteobacteria bacterium]